jgi:orotate phosphoribosyltransferase
MFEECRIEGDFNLSSGRKSPYFYDFDLLSSEATMEYVYALAELIPQDLRDEIDFIATPVLGGIEIAYVLAGILGKPRVKVLTVEERIRGPVFEGKNYLIVDDVISSGQAVNKVINILSDNRCIGTAAFVFRGTSEETLVKSFPMYYLEQKEPEHTNAGTA